jgi:hypothetical protein
MEIYSYKADQQGRKTCKYCRYHTKKLSKEQRDGFNENLPEEIIKKGFGICRMSGKIAKKEDLEEDIGAIAAVNDGYCSLFRTSILKVIFYRGKK